MPRRPPGAPPATATFRQCTPSTRTPWALTTTRLLPWFVLARLPRFARATPTITHQAWWTCCAISFSGAGNPGNTARHLACRPARVHAAPVSCWASTWTMRSCAVRGADGHADPRTSWHESSTTRCGARGRVWARRGMRAMYRTRPTRMATARIWGANRWACPRCDSDTRA